MAAAAQSTVSCPVPIEHLLAMLSYALVAFTIEFDNTFEARMPHTTTVGPKARSGLGPWLVSQAMWSNLLRFVTEQGKTVRELRCAIRSTNLPGLIRWGYLQLEPAQSGKKGDTRVLLTSHGGRAREIFLPLAGEIDARWRGRYGDASIAQLKAALACIAARLPAGRPHHLPVLGYGLMLAADTDYCDVALYGTRQDEAELPQLLARLLLALLLDYQNASRRSLCIDANLLAVIDGNGIPMRDLTRATGLAAAPLAMARKILGAGLEERQQGSSKTLHLTRQGMAAQAAYQRQMQALTERWHASHGDALIALGSALAALGADVADRGQALYDAIPAYPDGWRAALKTPHRMPRCPAVLHRGGYPDGA